ncbi:hypothetical protein [Coleofasciculus sp. G2-EDA-02]|uniref:hypothetical protein n=1 Tax=Coleofasciculus sp. G2-EDA-02 TaxID=3069529 RepID=UPI0032F79B71
MNQKLKNRGQLLHQASPTDNQNVAVIHSLLNQWGADSSLASEFSQALEWYEFELGDDLFSDRASNPSQNAAQSELNPSDLYVVCQGRVRLLGYNRLVLDKGILVEQGNHEQLIAEGGLYYHLAQQQLDL